MAESLMLTYTLISKSPSKVHNPDRLLLPDQTEHEIVTHIE